MNEKLGPTGKEINGSQIYQKKNQNTFFKQKINTDFLVSSKKPFLSSEQKHINGIQKCQEF